MATNPRLKLLVDKNSKKLVYAEAGKDFVDFLFGLLELPIGSILSILVGHGMSGSGSLDSLYQSIRDLDSNYLQPKQSKNSILTRKKADTNTNHSPLLKQLAYPKQESSSYSSAPSYSSCSSAPLFSSSSFGTGFSSSSCSSTSLFSSSSFGTGSSSKPIHSSCSSATLSGSLPFGSGFSSGTSCSSYFAPGKDSKVDGYVQGVVTYMVKDDLSVSPLSTASAIALIVSQNIKDISSLEEMNVVVDEDKGLKLLKASFASTTVLTDVFLASTSDEAKNNGLAEVLEEVRAEMEERIDHLRAQLQAEFRDPRQ